MRWHHIRHSGGLIDRTPFARQEETQHGSLTNTPVVGNRTTDLYFDLVIPIEGYEKEKLDIQIRRGNLIVSGTKVMKTKPEDNGYLQDKLRIETFEETYELGQYADPENMRARMESDKITIRMYHR